MYFHGDSAAGRPYSLKILRNVIRGRTVRNVELCSNRGLFGSAEGHDVDVILYLVRWYAGQCTNANRINLVVRVTIFFVVAMPVGLPWVT